ncbi:hypothetical protein SLA2020_400130 [Shorea laevis]
MIENEVRLKNWTPMRITRKGPSLTHVFFADDLILFGKATVENALTVINCLDRFCSFSGQKVNVHKSKILFSPNTDRQSIESICSITRMAATNDLERYLGVPIHCRRGTRNTYRNVVKKVQDRLSLWKANQLSFAGRQVLIHSVSSTMANHVMQIVKLPSSTCSDIDRANREFLWGGADGNRKIPLVRWERVCTPKSFGGLGFRATSLMNEALLAKLGWKVLTEPNALWVQVVKAKYFPNCDFLNVELKPSASKTWKSIIGSRELVQSGMGFVVSNGAKT